jgi:hypothetical protein
MSTTPYDPELPFLTELENQVRGRAEGSVQSERDGRSRAARPRQTRGSVGPSARRMLRRTAILVGLLCLIAASAFGARAVFFHGDESPGAIHQSALVSVAEGRDGPEQWRLSVYTRGSELCSALIVLGQQASSRCALSPAPDAIDVASLAGVSRRYVYGVGGSRVQAVRLLAGHTTLTVQTHPLDGERARAAGVTNMAHYFLAVLPRPSRAGLSAVSVTGLDAARRRLGQPQVTCVEEAAGGSCRS